MKKTISLFMVVLLVFLCGCNNFVPLNESVTGEQSTVRTTAEETTSAPATQAPTTAKPTEKQTEKITEKITQQTTAAAQENEKTTEESSESTTQAPKEEKTDFFEELMMQAGEIFGSIKLDEEPEFDPDKPMLALTFDDGPSAHTERLLNIFKEHGGKATFFVVGNCIDRRKDILKRMSDEGHEIGNHCWNHPNLSKQSEKEIATQISRTSSKIYEVTGKGASLVRPPYGAYNDKVKSVGKKLGVSFILWSVDTRDWESKNADAVYKSVMSSAKDGEMILLHDLHKTTVDAMERVIPELIEQGYQLVTVSQLLTSDGGSIEAGKTYSKRK